MPTTYPNTPGHKEPTTSRDAAQSMTDRAPTLRQRVENVLSIWCFTADETAEYMNESVLAIRPRFTELQRMGLIRDTGLRRKNSSGRMAKVWEAV